MSKVVFPILFFACTVASAQNDSISNDILTTRKFRKGIFVKYAEFKTNSPSIESGFSIEADTGLYDRYTLRFDKKKNKVRNVYAFSDGVDVYVNAAVYNQANYFVRIIFLGPITYFEDNRAKKNVSTGAIVFGGILGGVVGGALASSIAGSADPNNPGWILFLPDEDGEAYVLDRTNLISILKENDLALLKRFKAEKDNHKLDVLLRYVIEFNERSLNKNKP